VLFGVSVLVSVFVSGFDSLFDSLFESLLLGLSSELLELEPPPLLLDP